MNRETPHWGARTQGASEDSGPPLRVLIATELPETRIFVDRLYHEFTASGRRLHTDQLVQDRGNLPWLLVGSDEDV